MADPRAEIAKILESLAGHLESAELSLSSRVVDYHFGNAGIDPMYRRTWAWNRFTFVDPEVMLWFLNARDAEGKPYVASFVMVPDQETLHPICLDGQDYLSNNAKNAVIDVTTPTSSSSLSDDDSEGSDDDDDDSDVVRIPRVAYNDLKPSEMPAARAMAAGCLALNFIRKSTPGTAEIVMALIEVLRRAYGCTFPLVTTASPKSYDVNIQAAVWATRETCFYGNSAETKAYIKGHMLTTLFWMTRIMPYFFLINTDPYDILFSIPYYTTDEAEAAVVLAGELSRRPVFLLNKVRREKDNAPPFLVNVGKIMTYCVHVTLSVQNLEGEEEYNDMHLFGRLHSMDESTAILNRRMNLEDEESVTHVNLANACARLIGLANTLASNMGPWSKYPRGIWFQNDAIEVGLRSLNAACLDIYNPQIGATRMFGDVDIAQYLRMRTLLLLFEKLYACSLSGWFWDFVIWQNEPEDDDDSMVE